MNKFIVFIFLILVALNGFCEKRPLVNKGVEFLYSLEEENLLGKVQEMTLFKQEVIGSNYKPKIKYKNKVFNAAGRLLHDEKLEDNGKLHVIDSVFYYNNHVSELRTVFKYDNPTEWGNHHFKYIYDDDKNQITASLVQRSVRGDFKTTSQERIITTYDSLQNAIKEVRISNSDTTVTISKYTYNDFGKYTAIYHTYKTKSKTYEYSEIEDYDSNQNMTKQEFFDGGKMNYARYLKYNGSGKYDIESLREILNDSVSSITLYGPNFLQIEKKMFKRSELQTCESYQYKFDSQNNWIEKKVLTQDFSKGESEAKLILVETREISYYK
jgi:hypothetical protein